MEARITDINEIFADVDEIPLVQLPNMDAGNALIIAAPRVLRRGVLPNIGFRDIFTLVIQPSLIPWQ